MDKTQDKEKKYFCARCFLPVEADDKIDIEGQSFHKICSMCCVCQTIPLSVKMFYGHVFCPDCFKSHVLSRFRNEVPHMHSSNWWMQWGPHTLNERSTNNDGQNNDPNVKRSFCSRCLQPVDANDIIEIGGQCFHKQCAKCYFCHEIPKSKLKIYYGQMFCEDCFHRHVLNRDKENPSDFFKHCFDQWQNNAMFAENMRQFMKGNKESAPFVFMMQGPQSSNCRCGTRPQESFQRSEPKKMCVIFTAIAAFTIDEESFGAWDISFEYRTDVSEIKSTTYKESANEENLSFSATQKIEKLTKYLQKKENFTVARECCKKWKNFVEFDRISTFSNSDNSFCGWIDFQDRKHLNSKLECPKCLWQCGAINVNREFSQDEIVCGDF